MHRKLLALFSLSLLGFSLSVAAHADPIPAGTYNLATTSVLASGNTTSYSLTGTVTIGSDGLLTGADVTLDDAALGDPVFTTVSGANGPAGYNPVADYGYVAGPAGQLYLSYLPTLNTSGDVEICILSEGDCNSYQASTLQINSASAFGYSPVDLTGGSLDPAASGNFTPDTTGSLTVTPEPPSLVLLGTGIAGVVVFAQRRRFKI